MGIRLNRAFSCRCLRIKCAAFVCRPDPPFSPLPHANRTLPAQEQPDRRPHGGRHRSAVPPVVQEDGRGHGGVGDGDLQFPALRFGENQAPGQPRGRGGADLGADRRRRSGHDGRGGPLQRQRGRPDHRHQHGLPGQEGVQRHGRLGPAAGRAPGGPHPGIRGEGGAGYPGHAQDPHRLGQVPPQRPGHPAYRPGVRHPGPGHPRPHPGLRLQRRGGIRNHRGGEGGSPHSGHRQRRHHHPGEGEASCWKPPAPTPS
jgi:hypothetical protein